MAQASPRIMRGAFASEDRRAALLIVQYLASLTGPDKGAGPARQESLHVACDAIRTAFDLDDVHEGPLLNPNADRLMELLDLKPGPSGGGRTTPLADVEAVAAAAATAAAAEETVPSASNTSWISGGTDAQGAFQPSPSVSASALASSESSTDASGVAGKESSGGSKGRRSRPAPNGASKAKPATIGGDLTGRRILLVDDVKSVLRLGKRRLENAGAVVTTAMDGAEAVDTVAAGVASGEPFDMVLMDLHMPKMNGIEATKRIRQNHGAAAPLIIGLTADELVLVTSAEAPRTPPMLSRKAPRKKFVQDVSLGSSRSHLASHHQHNKAFQFRESGARGVISKPYTISQILDLAR